MVKYKDLETKGFLIRQAIRDHGKPDENLNRWQRAWFTFKGIIAILLDQTVEEFWLRQGVPVPLTKAMCSLVCRDLAHWNTQATKEITLDYLPSNAMRWRQLDVSSKGFWYEVSDNCNY